jgi:hypothetical protein
MSVWPPQDTGIFDFKIACCSPFSVTAYPAYVIGAQAPSSISWTSPIIHFKPRDFKGPITLTSIVSSSGVSTSGYEIVTIDDFHFQLTYNAIAGTQISPFHFTKLIATYTDATGAVAVCTVIVMGLLQVNSGPYLGYTWTAAAGGLVPFSATGVQPLATAVETVTLAVPLSSSAYIVGAVVSELPPGVIGSPFVPLPSGGPYTSFTQGFTLPGISEPKQPGGIYYALTWYLYNDHVSLIYYYTPIVPVTFVVEGPGVCGAAFTH